jgi:hypothetical protein
LLINFILFQVQNLYYWSQYLSLFEIRLFFNFWKIDIFELFFIFFHDLHLIFLIENRFLRCSAINLLAKNFLLTFFIFIDLVIFRFFHLTFITLYHWSSRLSRCRSPVLNYFFHIYQNIFQFFIIFFCFFNYFFNLTSFFLSFCFFYLVNRLIKIIFKIR